MLRGIVTCTDGRENSLSPCLVVTWNRVSLLHIEPWFNPLSIPSPIPGSSIRSMAVTKTHSEPSYWYGAMPVNAPDSKPQRRVSVVAMSSCREVCMRKGRFLLSIAVLVFMSALLAAKLPHLRLAMWLAAGDLDTQAIPVSDFKPQQFTEKTTSLRCGDLVFQVPEDTTIDSPDAEDTAMLYLKFGGVFCHVMSPQTQTDPEGEYFEHATWAKACGPDEVSRRIALYRTSSDELSFWMTGEQVASLEERLEVRSGICGRAEQAEVLAGDGLSGLLLHWTIANRHHIRLDYCCRERPGRGRVILTLNPDQPATTDRARAFLSSLRIAKESDKTTPGATASATSSVSSTLSRDAQTHHMY